MEISVTVQLGEGDSLAYTPDAAAQQVLAALGGNPTNDYCSCIVTMPATQGTAGTPPTPPSMPAE
jgi:hypothetical protein